MYMQNLNMKVYRSHERKRQTLAKTLYTLNLNGIYDVTALFTPFPSHVDTEGNSSRP